MPLCHFLLIVCSNYGYPIFRHLRDMTTCTVYVTVCDLGKSCRLKTFEIHLRLPIHVNILYVNKYYATLSKVLELERFLTAKVTFKVTWSHYFFVIR